MDNLDVKTVSKRSVYGILALASRTFLLQALNFVTFFVISIILSAGQLGIYTAVVAIQRVVSFLTDFGLGAALVQKKEELRREDLKTAFTLQSVITLSIFLIFFIFIGQIKSFFNLTDAGGRLLLALVFTIFLSSFKTIPSILLERKINFGRLVIPQIGESIIFNIVLVVLVINNFGIDSYTFAFLISAVLGIPLYYWVSPWKPGIGIYKASLSDLKFGIQFQAKNILATVKDDFLTVILVKFLPFNQIGYIGFAQKIAFFFYRYIVDSVTKVTFSSYSRLQENKEYLRLSIEKSLFFTSIIVFPALSGLIVVSFYLIKYLPGWGNKWEPAVISLIFFCLNALVSSISGVLVNVLDATGRVRTTLKLMVLWTILTWTLTPLAILLWGYNGVAIASFMVTLSVFITIYLVKQAVNFGFARSIYKPALATSIMVAVTYFMAILFVNNLFTLVFVIILGGAIYTFSIYILAGKEIAGDLRKLFVKHET
ncbi:MAG: Polysaccharide biosynthesis protein [Microgenomates group bacterium GW2011_GWA2_37_6]|nr:MAG: Polysaccharide biosynthesis protein [Microgenomates group bacterium GW2011_GWA2_37_6]